MPKEIINLETGIKYVKDNGTWIEMYFPGHEQGVFIEYDTKEERDHDFIAIGKQVQEKYLTLFK